MLPPKHADEENRLAALHRYDVLDTVAEKSFDGITRLVAYLCDTPMALISLIDGNRQWFKSEIGIGVNETSLDVSICAHAILENKLFIVNDTLADARFADNALVTGDPHLRFYAGAQLTTPDGFPLGSLCVLDNKPRDLSDQQKDALEILAGEVINLLEMRLLMRQQANLLEERRAIHELLTISERKHRTIAETLQSALLMPPPPDKFPGLTVGTYYKGAWEEAEVAGDFFDAFVVAAGKVALVLGDVTGKGLTAAAYTAEIKFALRATLRDLRDPAQALERLNHYLIESRLLEASAATPEQYVALLIALVDTTTGVVRYAGGGAEPPLVVRADRTTHELAAYGPLLGADASAVYEAADTYLKKGDIIVMTTDGITESRRRGQVGRGSELFGYERFTAAAAEAAHLPSPAAMIEAIAKAALEFASGAQADDICLLAARFE